VRAALELAPRSSARPRARGAPRGHGVRSTARPMASTFRRSTAAPLETDSPTIDWTLALAGGDGMRLAEYVERRFGRRIPKQYCCLLGDRSMIQHTLDRTLALTPASRTLTVIGSHHEELALPQLAGRSDHVFRQPSSRDTGVAIYVALAM